MEVVRIEILIIFAVFISSCGSGTNLSSSPTPTVSSGTTSSTTKGSQQIVTLVNGHNSYNVGSGTSNLFSATGGQPPYAFSILSGGGALVQPTQISVTFQAPPAVQQTSILTIDSAGSKDTTNIWVSNLLTDSGNKVSNREIASTNGPKNEPRSNPLFLVSTAVLVSIVAVFLKLRKKS